MTAICQYCHEDTVIAHSEGGTCLSCCRVDVDSQLSPVPVTHDHSYLRHWTSSQIHRQLADTLSEIGEREHFSELVTEKIKSTFKEIREASSASQHINTLILASVFYGANTAGIYFPLTKCARYCDTPSTLTSLNQKLSRVLSKAGLHYPIPSVRTICEYASSVLSLPPRQADELLRRVKDAKIIFGEKKIFFRDEVLVGGVSVSQGFSSIQTVSSRLFVSQQSVRKALRHLHNG